MGREFGQRSDRCTCGRKTNRREILCLYGYHIFTNGLTPFVRRVYPGRHRFVQDNDPKHTSRIAKQYMADNNINWWCTPPESPDLNPTEMVWSALKRNLECEGKPRNKVQLIDCIKDFWRQHLTPQVCRNYIGHLKKVVPYICWFFLLVQN